MSGVDLPLKTQDETYAFFENNSGKEFVEIDSFSEVPGHFYERIGQYHFLQDYIGRNGGYKSALMEHLEMGLLKIQSFLHINRKFLRYKKIYKGIFI